MADRAVFLDRDDTLIEDPGYINHPGQVKLLPGAAQAVRKLREKGFKLVVVSNQSGVARGIVSEEVLEQIHSRLKELLAEQQAYVDKIYYCPYHPDGSIEQYRKESDMRKPNPGMLLKAAEELGLDMESSWMIGDSYRDVTAGSAAGCRTILLKSYNPRPVAEPVDAKADFEAINLLECVNIIKREISVNSVNKDRPIEPAAKEQAEKRVEVEDDEAIAEAVQSEANDTAGAGEEDASKRQRQSEAVSMAVQSEPADVVSEHRQRTHQHLEEMKGLLKKIHRESMYEEFSTTKLLAGVVQVMALFCLMMAVWHKIGAAERTESVLTALGFAAVLQLVSLTLFVMHNRR